MDPSPATPTPGEGDPPNTGSGTDQPADAGPGSMDPGAIDEPDPDEPPAPPCGGDCPDGTECNEETNECETIAVPCPCEAGSFCDEATNTCQDGCREDDDCAATDVCDTDAGACVPGCRDDDGCPAGEICDEGSSSCVPGCRDDDDCGEGQQCNTSTLTCEDRPPECPGTVVPGLVIERVTINQAVEIPLFDNGNEVDPRLRQAPVVQDRAALIRVSVRPEADYVPTEVTGVLTVQNAGVDTVVTATGLVNQASDESTLEGTMNFEVAAELMGPDAQISLVLTQLDCTDAEGDARFPADGLAELDTREVGRFKVMLVPYQRAPFELNTSDEALEAIRNILRAFYPITGVDLEVHEPIPVMNPSTNLQRVLQHLGGLRADENPSDNTYYYGMFTEADTFREACGNSCVAGIATLGGNGPLGNPNDRYGVGVGYISDAETTSSGVPTTDEAITLDVMVHELGHTLGRRHAPCGDPAGVDRNFPTSDANTGVPGYNMFTGELMSPDTYTDVMAYCPYSWIHPYTYNAIATRIAGINSAFQVRGEQREFASVLVQEDGTSVRGENLHLRGTPSGEATQGTVFNQAGQPVATVDVSVAELSDSDAVLVTLPVPSANWATLQVAGKRVALPSRIPAL